MQEENIKAAVRDAKVFLKRAEELLKTGADYSWASPKESGALRRASMELTRSLATMRKP